jgi:hypothetical protein
MIYQNELQKHFAKVSNLLGQDSSLNNFEVRLLLHLASIPPKSRFSIYKFTSSKTFGHRTKYYDAEKRLIQKGYLSKSIDNDYTILWELIDRDFETFKKTKFKPSPNGEGSRVELKEASQNSEVPFTIKVSTLHQTAIKPSPNSETYIRLNTNNKTIYKTANSISPNSEVGNSNTDFKTTTNTNSLPSVDNSIKTNNNTSTKKELNTTKIIDELVTAFQNEYSTNELYLLTNKNIGDFELMFERVFNNYDNEIPGKVFYQLRRGVAIELEKSKLVVIPSIIKPVIATPAITAKEQIKPLAEGKPIDKSTIYDELDYIFGK